MVWEDEYIIEAKGDWCPWSPNIRSCERVFSKGTYRVDQAGNVKLLRSERLLALSENRKQVEYNPKEDLCLIEGIKDCEPNYVLSAYKTPNDPLYSNLWGLNGKEGINAERAWDINTHQSGHVVAVIDSGVDCNHEDLTCIGEYDAITGQTTQRDDNGHGTHVAGTICASGNNSSGVTGVVWNCSLLAVKFLNENGSGSTFHAIKGIDWAVANGATLVNASWGGTGYSGALYNSIKRAKAAGVLFIAAAGNSGVDNDIYPHYPSSYNLSNIIAVASIDEDGKKSGFSNYGINSVDIAAPGRRILSAQAGGGYLFLDGTSMATPHVTGVAALLPNPTKETILASSRESHLLKRYLEDGRVLDAYQAVSSCNKNKLKKCRGDCNENYLCKYIKQRKCRKSCKETWCPTKKNQ